MNTAYIALRDEITKKLNKAKVILTNTIANLIHDNEEEFFSLVFYPYAAYLKAAPPGFREHLLSIAGRLGPYLLIYLDPDSYIEIRYPYTVQTFPIFLHYIHIPYTRIRSFSKFDSLMAMYEDICNLSRIGEKNILYKYDKLAGSHPQDILAQLPELIPLLRNSIPEGWIPEENAIQDSLLTEYEANFIRRLLWIENVF
jgi:hypothetical protein